LFPLACGVDGTCAGEEDTGGDTGNQRHCRQSDADHEGRWKNAHDSERHRHEEGGGAQSDEPDSYAVRGQRAAGFKLRLVDQHAATLKHSSRQHYPSAIPFAVDPPTGERAAARAATPNGPGRV
jgi:hypothetical protein